VTGGGPAHERESFILHERRYRSRNGFLRERRIGAARDGEGGAMAEERGGAGGPPPGGGLAPAVAVAAAPRG
jgi:hypothetical protein